ncbi:MAG: hypothetical protein HOH13_11390, partial [Crocinitomicaceae bacterium]|nr:hypothetical protein [Crocinitomicaceae bacterium]
MYKLILAVSFILLFDLVSAQITTNGSALTDLSSSPGTCAVSGFQTVNFASTSGSCINLTTNGLTLESGAVWTCDANDLNQTFKVSFTANFGSDVTTGDGIAFLLQIEGVPNDIGGQGGGIGYSDGDAVGCLSAPCPISPSLAVEFDTYDHTTFSINDIACDHMSMQVNGDMGLAGTVNGPTCLISGGTTVKDGLDHDICITWDPSSFGSLQVYFDGLLVSTYAGDIRSFFGLSASTVSWGFTSAKGPAPQIHTICNVNMETNIASPSCSCVTEDASFTVTDFCSGSANAASGIATSGGTFSFNPAPGDGALINPATGEVINGVAGTTYTVQYVTSGLCPGTSTQNVTVIALDDPSYAITDYCEGAVNSATGIVTPGGVFSFSPDLGDGSTINALTGEITNGVAGTTYTIEYLTNGVCPASLRLNVTVSPSDDPAFTLTDYCEGGTNAAAGIATGGGVFSFDPDLGDGSTVDGSTGEITSGVAGTTYTLEYVTAGACPDSSAQTVTVTTNDDPAFILTDYCEGGTNAATGIATVGGVFSFDPDLGDGSTVDGSTGEITSGVAGTSYTLEYVTAGVCPDSSTQTVTVTTNDDPAFTLTDYCDGSANSATGIATGGGVFSFDPDLGDGSTVD